MVEASRNVTLTEYLTELVRDLMYWDLEEMARRLPPAPKRKRGQ